MNLNVASVRPASLRGLALSIGLMLAPAALAQDAAPEATPAAGASRTLTGLDVASTDGGAVRITMTLSAPAPEPVVFSVDKPARVSLDLADTKLSVPERYKRVGAGRVHTGHRTEREQGGRGGGKQHAHGKASWAQAKDLAG